MTGTSSVIDVRDISVRYRTRRSFFRHDVFLALDQVSFSVEKGETLGVVGTNGCGKSTLLQVLANICGIDGGEIKWRCRQVSLMSLSVGFDVELSGRDNAVVSAMLLGARRREAIDCLDEIIEFAELGAFIDKPIKTYSSGMRARLGFSVALTMKAELLLIDEVLAVGDGRFQEKAESAMVEKMGSEQTAVLVSHSLQQVQKLCNRTLWLEAGKVKMLGKTDRVVAEYQQFLGAS